jgi:hypothetical protein
MKSISYIEKVIIFLQLNDFKSIVSNFQNDREKAYIFF